MDGRKEITTILHSALEDENVHPHAVPRLSLSVRLGFVSSEKK